MALFDLDQPERCLLRGDSWIFGPERYEREGDVANVAFPCGYTLDDGDTLNLYYGAADTSIALATGSVRQLLRLARRAWHRARARRLITPEGDPLTGAVTAFVSGPAADGKGLRYLPASAQGLSPFG
jgi:hypothetical protein